MKLAVYPGSFDPVTSGHTYVVRSAAQLFDKVVVLIAHNSGKRYRFEATERQEIFASAVADLPNVEVRICQGLVAQAAAELGAVAIIKGVRGTGDFESESAQAHVNAKLAGIPTLLLPAPAEYAHISSSLVKELYDLGVEITDMVPEATEKALREPRNEK